MAFSKPLITPAAPRAAGDARARGAASGSERGSADAQRVPQPTPAPRVRNELRGEVFRDAALGICAVVATVDGAIDPAMRMRVAQLIGAHEVLNGYSAEELRDRFEDNCARLIMDPAFGHAYVMQQIARALETPEQTGEVVRIGCAVGESDGALGAHATAVLAEACQVLHLDAAEFLPGR